MHRNLEVLLELQTLELRVREIESEIAALPRRVAAIEAKLAGTQQGLERAQAAVAGSQSERRQVEREIEALREKIVKIRAHSGDVKTNQEYKALLDEIAFAEGQIGKHEERILQIMEQAEGLEQSVAAAQAQLAGEQKEIATETKAASARSAKDRAERDRLNAQRAALRDQVDAQWLARFDRVLKARGQAIASVDREACSGCRVRLRPQFLQEMCVYGDRLFVCESCGRILFTESVAVNN